MDPNTSKLLEAADDPQYWESPPGFNWQNAMERVRCIQPTLEAIAGRNLLLDDQIQDASYFADLRITELKTENGLQYERVIFSVAFSCFGSLVTIFNEQALSEDKVREMHLALERQGFVFVSDADLSVPYSGCHPGFAGKTWFDRYFNYS